jgi:hypothetical protein
MTDQLLDLEQACARLATSPATFRRWLRVYRVQPAVVGRGPGGKNRYRAADIDRLGSQVSTHEQPLTDHEQPVIDQISTHERALIALERPASDQTIALEAVRGLVAEMAAMRHERDRLRHEHDELLARALAAEWEAARLRPLTVLPDPPPVKRRRWWQR